MKPIPIEGDEVRMVKISHKVSGCNNVVYLRCKKVYNFTSKCMFNDPKTKYYIGNKDMPPLIQEYPCRVY